MHLQCHSAVRGRSFALGRGADLRVAGGLSRRFGKDYECLPETAQAMIYGAMSRLMRYI